MDRSNVEHVVVPHFCTHDVASHHLIKLLGVHCRRLLLLLLLMTMTLSFLRFLLVLCARSESLHSSHVILLACALIDIHTPLREWNSVEFLLIFILRFDVFVRVDVQVPVRVIEVHVKLLIVVLKIFLGASSFIAL